MQGLKKMYDLTDLSVEDFLKRVDEYVLSGGDVADIVYSFRSYERACLKGMHKYFIKQHPYDYNAKMALSTDVSPATLRRIINKK